MYTCLEELAEDRCYDEIYIDCKISSMHVVHQLTIIAMIVALAS
jgi:hypothetical protein